MSAILAKPAHRRFRAIYRSHYGLVWHALFRFGVDTAAIDDAIQDVFVIAYRRRSEFRGSSIKAWLYGIARGVASNYRRSDRRRARREQAARITFDGGARAMTDVHETIQALERALASLDAEERELFILSEIEGMTGTEIARARDRNVQTVYTQVRKLRERMHERFDVTQVRRTRPQATAKSWLLLTPKLQAVVKPVVGVASWTGVLTSGWAVATVGAALVTGVVVADRVRAPANEPAIAIESRPPAAEAAPAAALARDPSVEPLSTRNPPVDLLPTRDPPVVPVQVALPDDDRDTPTVQAPKAPGSIDAKPSAFANVPDKAATDPLAVETELLGRASAALRRGAPQQAIRITDEHSESFPLGPLTDLRAALRIEALCAMDKVPQARGEAQRFEREHGGSPLLPRVEQSCAGAP